MGSDGQHFEEYVHLADVTSESALISWGGFWFRLSSGRDHALVDDDEPRRRRESIGARSKPFGHGAVERDRAGPVVSRAETTDASHVWIRSPKGDPVPAPIVVDHGGGDDG